MANYNTFVVVDCKNRKNVLVTSSASKANAALKTGFRVEVWNQNAKTACIYARNRHRMNDYLQAERLYHREKQQRRERFKQQRENRVR